MSSLNKGIRKVEVALSWDQAPMGGPANDLDLITATYTSDDPHGTPAYLVHFDQRSPDGTITLNRVSETGQGFGADEVLTLELDRLASTYHRVVVGVVIQQNTGRRTFGDVPNTAVRIREGYDELARTDFGPLAGATAATIAEFSRNDSGAWVLQATVRGFDADPRSFVQVMGGAPS